MEEIYEPTALNFGDEFSNALQVSNPVQAVAPPNQTDAFPVHATDPAASDSNAPVITQPVPRPTQAAASVVNETTAPCAA